MEYVDGGLQPPPVARPAAPTARNVTAPAVAATKRNADPEEPEKAAPRSAPATPASAAKPAPAAPAPAPTGKPAAVGAAPATPPAKKVEKICVLKDGTKIRVQSILGTGDSYVIKDADGKMHTIAKSDVQEIAQQEADAAAPASGAEKPAPKSGAGETTAVPAVPGKTPGATTYLMKDGRRIKALKVVEMDKELSIKDESGKFQIINKADVLETQKETP
jgi:hypothetical protein